MIVSASLLAVLPFFDPWFDIFKRAFLLAGVLMVLLSVVFFLFALEFYDSASGWRGTKTSHFHLAGIAGNSFLFGVSLALTGSALLVSGIDFAINVILAGVLATGALFVLVSMAEIERALWDLGRPE